MESISTDITSNVSRINQVYSDKRYRLILIVLYSTVFLGGICGTVMMLRVMFKRNEQSVMSTIILNILVLHSILQVSLPFRLSYYISGAWEFGSFACQLVSSIIYGHMYFTFVFYVTIVILQLLIYFKKLQIQQLQKYHMIVLSIIIWVIGSIIFWLVLFKKYGVNSHKSAQQCFEFHRELNLEELIIFNYSMIVIIMTTVVTLFLIQMGVIIQLVKSHWPNLWAYQDYRAQIKSLFFLLVIVFCFMPHHVFRIHFIQNYRNEDRSELVFYNEISVALTTLCCLDMLCFIGGIIY